MHNRYYTSDHADQSGCSPGPSMHLVYTEISQGLWTTSLTVATRRLHNALVRSGQLFVFAVSMMYHVTMNNHVTKLWSRVLWKISSCEMNVAFHPDESFSISSSCRYLRTSLLLCSWSCFLFSLWSCGNKKYIHGQLSAGKKSPSLSL